MNSEIGSLSNLHTKLEKIFFSAIFLSHNFVCRVFRNQFSLSENVICSVFCSSGFALDNLILKSNSDTKIRFSDKEKYLTKINVVD